MDQVGRREHGVPAGDEAGVEEVFELLETVEPVCCRVQRLLRKVKLRNGGKSNNPPALLGLSLVVRCADR